MSVNSIKQDPKELHFSHLIVGEIDSDCTTNIRQSPSIKTFACEYKKCEHIMLTWKALKESHYIYMLRQGVVRIKLKIMHIKMVHIMRQGSPTFFSKNESRESYSCNTILKSLK